MTTIALELPAQAEAQWQVVERCPACDADSASYRVMIPDRHYMFGGEQVPLPDEGVAIVGCGCCGLAYKSAVPSPDFLARIFERHAAAKWTVPHDFSDEAKALRRLTGDAGFDLLDVGAAGGALLQAWADQGVQGRRSALDVVRYPGIEQHLAGEFIEGFLDAQTLNWSRQPYGVATLFDVLEHLYRPQTAFENLRLLVRQGGYVFIETGNIVNFWPQHFGISQWWYVRLIEHHIFWSRDSLQKIAEAHGFEVVFFEERRHKSQRELLFGGMLAELMKVGLYCVTAGYYGAIARLCGRQGNQPWFPFAKDHFQACLRKK